MTKINADCVSETILWRYGKKISPTEAKSIASIVAELSLKLAEARKEIEANSKDDNLNTNALCIETRGGKRKNMTPKKSQRRS